METMKYTLIVAVLACLAIAAGPVLARDVYVNNVVGNDAASGRNEIGEPGGDPSARSTGHYDSLTAAAASS